MQFRSEGKAVLYVTHRLSEVVRLADRITILRDGKRVGVFLRGEVSRADIVRLMTKDVASGGARCGKRSASDAIRLRRSQRTRIQIRDLIVRPKIYAREPRPPRRVGSSVSPAFRAQVTVIFCAPLPASTAPTAAKFSSTVVNCRWDRCGMRCRRGYCWYRQIVAEQRSSPRCRCAPIFVSATEFVRSVRRFGLRWPREERAMAQYYINRLSVRPPYAETRIERA